MLSDLHRTSGDDESGNVHPSHGHEHSGGDLVTVGDTDPSIEGVSLDHDLACIGDDLPGDEGVSHSLVSHRDTVTDSGDTEDEGLSAGLDDSLLHSLDDLVEVDVTGNDLVPGIRDGDERFVEIRIVQTVRPEETPGGCLVQTFLDCITSHDGYLTLR